MTRAKIESMMIGEMNDAFRLISHNGVIEPEALAKIPKGFQRNGRIAIAGGLASASRAKQMAALWAATKDQEFEPENDPYGEHDFGAVLVPSTANMEGFKIFWKIDYYSDAEMEYGAEDPASESTYRVLTVMFAEDY
jgi:Protein of unknown function (DUF3768)